MSYFTGFRASLDKSLRFKLGQTSESSGLETNINCKLTDETDYRDDLAILHSYPSSLVQWTIAYSECSKRSSRLRSKTYSRRRSSIRQTSKCNHQLQQRRDLRGGGHHPTELSNAFFTLLLTDSTKKRYFVLQTLPDRKHSFARVLITIIGNRKSKRKRRVRIFRAYRKWNYFSSLDSLGSKVTDNTCRNMFPHKMRFSNCYLFNYNFLCRCERCELMWSCLIRNNSFYITEF